MLASSAINHGDNNRRSTTAPIARNPYAPNAAVLREGTVATDKAASAAESKQDMPPLDTIQNDTGNAGSSTLVSAAGAAKAAPKVQDANNSADAATAVGNNTSNKDGMKKSKLGKQKRSGDGEAASLKGSDGTSGTGYGSSKRRRKVEIS